MREGDFVNRLYYEVDAGRAVPVVCVIGGPDCQGARRSLWTRGGKRLRRAALAPESAAQTTAGNTTGGELASLPLRDIDGVGVAVVGMILRRRAADRLAFVLLKQGENDEAKQGVVHVFLFLIFEKNKSSLAWVGEIASASHARWLSSGENVGQVHVEDVQSPGVFHHPKIFDLRVAVHDTHAIEKAPDAAHLLPEEVSVAALHGRS